MLWVSKFIQIRDVTVKYSKRKDKQQNTLIYLWAFLISKVWVKDDLLHTLEFNASIFPSWYHCYSKAQQ